MKFLCLLFKLKSLVCIMEMVLSNGPPSFSGLGEAAAGDIWSSVSPQLIPERSWLAAPLLLLALL